MMSGGVEMQSILKGMGANQVECKNTRVGWSGAQLRLVVGGADTE